MPASCAVRGADALGPAQALPGGWPPAPGLRRVHRANDRAFRAPLRWNVVVTTYQPLCVRSSIYFVSSYTQNKTLETVAALCVWLDSKVCKSSKKPHTIKTVFEHPVPHYMSPQAPDEVAGSWLAFGRASLCPRLPPF